MKTKTLTAEILSIGTELLLGDVVNTNAAFLSKQLSFLGIDVHNQTVVGDNKKRIIEALNLASKRADIIITTGGLGPTFDDITKETISDFLELEMIFDKKAHENIKKIFTNKFMTENNKKQAYLPKGSIPLYNENGTAPGIIIEKNNLLYVVLPGPPFELEPMFFEKVLPVLLKKSNHILYHHTLHIFGIGESALEDILGDIMIKSNNPSVAPYASMGEVMLRITASAETKEEAEKLIAPTIEKIKNLVGNYIYGIDIGNLQQAVIKLYKRKNLTLSTAESCTGGILSSRIIEVSGSSAVFSLGVITYSDKEKIKIINVNKDIIIKYGAVSSEVALEMARGIRKLSNSDVGVSTTGIAGPTGGSAKKPIGLVYVAVASRKYEKVIKLNLFSGYGNQRQYIRYVAASNALNLALKAGNII